jgi:hypothetical protein
MEELTLSSQEIYAITHYKLPKKQLAALREMGIPRSCAASTTPYARSEQT